MAENVNANININIDTSDAVAQLRLLQSQIATFNKALVASNAAAMTAQKNMVNTLVAQIGATHQFSTSVTNVETSVSRLGKAIDKNKLSLGEYFKYGMAASSRFGRMFNKQQEEITNLAVDRVKRLQTQYIALERAQGGMTKALAVRPLQLFNADTAIAIQKSQLFNKLLHDGSTSLINWGKNTQWAGRQLMVGFTVPLTIFGGMAGKIFMDLEKQVVKFRRVYGDATTPLAETDAMIGQIKELAKEYTKYGIAVSDTIALAGDAAAAGAQGENLIAATAQATRLGTLGMIDQQQALTATIALQSAFRMSNEDLANSVNFLNAVENQTVVSLADITEAIPLVAPVIQGLGGDVQDLAMFMAAMREGGVNASEGANALKSGLASLINPTKAAREQLSAVGIDIDSILSKNKGDLRGIVMEFGAALGTLDKFQRQQVLAKMFGKYQFARLGALFDNINRSGSQAQRVLGLTTMSVEELGALADKELGAISESVGVKFTASVERFKLALAPIGETFLRIATPIIDFATKIAEKFNELSPTAKQFTVILVAALGVVVPTLVMVTGLFANFFGQIIKGLATFKNFFTRITGGASSLSYLSEQELDAAAASATLEGKVDSLTSSLNVQKAAVKGLARAYGGYIAAAQTAATNLPSGAIRTPRPRRMATGGFVAGTGNKDTEPALLTPGEFVVNKDAAQRFGPILGAMNNGTIKQLAKGHKTHLTERMTFAGPAGALEFLGSDSGFSTILNVILDIETAIGRSVSKLAAVSNLVVDMPAAFNRAMMKTGDQAMTGQQFARGFAGKGLEKWELTSRVAGENFEDLLPHLQILDDNVVRIGRQMDRVGDFNIDDVMRQAFDQLPAESRRMLTNIENLSTQFNNLRITVMDLDRLTEEQKATLRALGYSWTREGNRVRVFMDGDEILSARTRQETKSVGPTYRNVSVRDTQSAAAGGVTLADAADDAARARMGAASPAMAGADLMHDYAAGMLVGARQSAAMAGQAGAILGGAAGAGVMGGGIPGQPITQSGMTFLPSPMGLFLPERAGDGPDKPTGGAGAPDGGDADSAKKIDDVGKAADNTGRRVGGLGKVLGSVGRGLGAFGMIASIATGGLMLMDGKVGEIAQSLFPLVSMLDIGFIAMEVFGGSAGGAAGALGTFGAAAASAALPVTLIVAAVVALIGTFVLAYKKFQFLRDAVADLGDSLKELGNTIIQPIIDNFGSIQNAVSKATDFIMVFVNEGLKNAATYFTIIIKYLQIFVKLYTMFIGLVQAGARFIGLLVKKFMEWRSSLGPVQKILLDMVFPIGTLIEVFKALPGIVQKAFGMMREIIVTQINIVIDVINFLIDNYNKLHDIFQTPVVARIDYIITTTGTGPTGAPGLTAGQNKKKERDGWSNMDPGKNTPPPPPEDLPTGGAAEKQLTALQELRKSLVERLKLFTNFGDLMKQYKGKTNAFARALGQTMYGGGIADKLRKMNLNESLIADILAQGYDKAKQIVDQLKKRKGLADQLDAASSIGRFAEKMNEIANAGIEAKMQTKAANLARSQGASEDVVKRISEDYDLALRFTKLPANQRKQIIVEIQTTIDQEEALAAAQDPTKVYKDEIDMLRLAQDVATSASKKKIEGLQRELDLVNRQISAIEQLNDKDRQAIRGLERQKEMIERQIEQYERQNELDQRRIDSLKREDELRNRVADAINHDLNILSQQEETIRQQYQQRIDALNEIGQLNDHIVESQKQQLGLAQALSQGDIYAAAAAAQDMQASQGQFAREQQTAALQQGMENQVAGLTTAGGLTRQQAEEQINAIKEQSYQTGLKIQEIEDGIYQRNLLIIPLKESQRNLDLAIRDLNDAIFNRETEILGIQNNKVKPIQEQIQAEQDVLDATNLAFETRIAELDLAIKSNELMQKSIKNADNLARAWHSVATEIANANKVLRQQIEAAGPGPKATDYASTKEFASAVQAYNSLLDGFKKARDAAVAAAMQRGKNAMASTTLYTGGLVKGYAGGNYVMGNGGRDSVPAMLTPGEFVVRKSMVKKYGLPTFSRMNTGSLPQFDKIQTGSLPRFQLPGTQEISGDIQRQANINLFAPRNDTGYNNISVNVNVPQTNASPDAIANKVAMKIDNINRRGIGNQRVYKQ